MKVDNSKKAQLSAVCSRIGRMITVLVVISLLVIVVVPAGAAPLILTDSLSSVHITDVRGATFVISWATVDPSDGIVRCVDDGGTPISEVLDPISGTTVHVVTVAVPAPNAQYQCEVESNGFVSGPHTVATGPTLDDIPPPANTIWGSVLLAGLGGAAPYTNVYLRLKDLDGLGSPGMSQWVSARADGNGIWFYLLSNVRTEDLLSYFSYSPGVDEVEIWVQGGEHGAWGLDEPLETTFLIPDQANAQMPDFELSGAPLAVTLSDFAAAVDGDGVAVGWETVSEVGNVGFNLYRNTKAEPGDAVVAYVPSQAPSGAGGAIYEWRDADVVAGETYWYWLEDVSVSGTATLHGPVSVTMTSPTAVSLVDFSTDSDLPSLAIWVRLVLADMAKLLAGW